MPSSLGCSRMLIRSLQLIGVEDSHLGAHTRPIRFVEIKKHRRRPVAALLLIAMQEVRADPLGAQKIALGRQKRQLVGDVELAELGAELDAIEDRHTFAQADMFRPKVTMSFDNPARASARFE